LLHVEPDRGADPEPPPVQDLFTVFLLQIFPDVLRKKGGLFKGVVRRLDEMNFLSRCPFRIFLTDVAP
jgi:hypothetical protein